MKRILASVLVGMCLAGCGDDKTESVPLTDTPGSLGTEVAPILPRAKEQRVLAFMNRGLAFLERYEYSLAAAEFEEAAGLAPGWYPGVLNLGIARLNVQKDPELTLGILSEAASLAPDEAAPRFLQGIVLTQGVTPPRMKEAEAAFRAAVERAPDDADARHRLAMVLKEHGDTDGAERLLTEALERNPDLGAALYQRGLLRRTLGREEEGRADLAAFQELQQAGRNDERGMSYGALGPLGNAVRDLDRWLEPVEEAPLPEVILERVEGALDDDRDPGGTVVLADLDDDGVLDLVLGGAPVTWRRGNGDATFGEARPVPGTEDVPRDADVAVGDIDSDGRLDLVVNGAGLLLQQEDGWRQVRHEKAGVDGGRLIADLDADGDLDVLAGTRVLLNDARGGLEVGSRLELPNGGPLQVLRMMDVDGDGALDVLARVKLAPAWFRNRRGGVFDPPVPTPLGLDVEGAFHCMPSHDEDHVRLSIEADLDGDGDLDRVRAVLDPERAGDNRLVVERCTAGGPANLLCVRLKGVLNPNGKQFGWSNPRGVGTRVEVFTGRRRQVAWMGQGQAGPGKSPPDRLWFDLGDHEAADLVSLRWTEGVIQAEADVKPAPGGAPVVIEQVQRKAASCPVVFSWDGEKWVFVADSMGGGGLGFYVAPGVYGQPDTTERIRIDRTQLAERDGFYEVILAEPLEEICMADRLALTAVDHPAGSEAYPDERFGGDGGLPTERVYVHADDERVFPVAARDLDGNDVLDRLADTDRVYADGFTLHRDLLGFTEADHGVVFDFGDRVPELKEGQRLVLFVDGWIEYGYSRTFYAAAQSGAAITSPVLEVPDGKGGWTAGIADLGYMAGTPRTMTRNVTGVVTPDRSRFRIRTNLEIYLDRVWLAVDRGEGGLVRTSAAPANATLRFAGFPEEVSPDGRLPKMNDYSRMLPGMPGFKAMKGEYTRYGDVRELLLEADDRTVIFRNGEEIRLRFSVKDFPPLREGWVRTFLLETEGWCKDMDPYTAEGDSVEPLPWRGMSSWPPPAGERIPDTEAIRAWRREWNTRVIR